MKGAWKTSSRYLKTDPSLWHGREDPLRFHHVIKCVNLKKEKLPLVESAFALIGFACDEGVRRNRGRPGAKEGPQEFRKALCNLTIQEPIPIYDLGDVVCDDGDLESSQKVLGSIVAHAISSGMLPVVIGGGHELAWGQFQGLNSFFSDISIINFDAHFDMRPLLLGKKGSSGTSFLQIAQEEKKKFHYLCLGIQETGNTKSLFETANRWNVEYLLAEEIHNDSKLLEKCIQQFLGSSENIYLSICLDVFASSFAPGVSSPQPLGLYPAQIAPLLKTISDSGKLIGIGIAELSPPLDHNKLTSKLAASLFAQFTIK